MGRLAGPLLRAAEVLGVPGALASLVWTVRGPTRGGPISLPVVGALYLLIAVALLFLFFEPYYRLYTRIGSAIRSPTDAEDGDTVALTGQLVADGTIRSPISQTPVAVAAWHTSVDSSGSNSGEGEYGDGRGIHSAIGGLRVSGEVTEIDLPSAIVQAADDTGLDGGWPRVQDRLAYQVRRTPGLLAGGLLVAFPGMDSEGEVIASDESAEATLKRCKYPAGEPPRKVRAFVGEHRSQSRSSPLRRIFGLTPGRITTDGGSNQSTESGSKPEGGRGQRRSTNNRDREPNIVVHESANAATNSEGDTGESTDDVDNTGRGGKDSSPTYSAWSRNIEKRATVTILGTYRIGGYVEERVIQSDDDIDVLAVGGYDRLYGWARNGLFHSGYLAGCFAALGIVALVY